MEITANDASYVRDLVLRHSAIVLDSEKDYLIEMRLAQLANDCGAPSIGELINKARRGERGADIRIVEAMTTHETYFFRDVLPFEMLRTQLLPKLIANRHTRRSLNLWCAACSSGQEPYSVALMIREHFPALSDWRVRIMATDLSEQVLTKARAGSFTQMEVNRGLPAQLLVRHFERAGTHWRLKANIRDMVEFRQLNLIDSWNMSPTPDVVLLRNVLIYFDLPSKRRILDRLRQQIAPDGVLFLGAAETTLNVADGWERVANDGQTYYKVEERR